MDARAREPLRDVGAVLFDMDGLLIDSEPVWIVALDAFCQKRGVRYADRDVEACMGRGLPNAAKYLAITYGWELDLTAQLADMEDEFRARATTAAPMRGAPELLSALRGHRRLALGSSTVRPLIDAALGARVLGDGRRWLDAFDAVVSGSDVANVKPAPDIFLECARRMAVHPDRCVVLEDSPAGCEAARAAGMRVIAVPASDHAAFAARADVFVSDLFAAAELLLTTRAPSPVKSPGTPYAV
jgi:beta-phosphoglucomutase-like phosphatase (HAD superfamily)